MIDRIPGLLEALVSLYPGAIWTLRGDDLDWSDENDLPPPTKEELQTEVERLQADYEAKEYQRLRAPEYPSFAEQFDLLYHGGYDAWKAEIDKIKDKYPKPE